MNNRIKKYFLQLWKKIITYNENRKWLKRRAELIANASNKKLAEVVVDSQYNYMKADSLFNEPINCIDQCFVAVEAIANNDFLNNVVGVQPMSGPVGLAYTLDYSESEQTEHGKKLTLNVNKHAVAASSRRCQVTISATAIEDLKRAHLMNDEDFSKEFSSIIAEEFKSEINAFVLDSLKRNASLLDTDCVDISNGDVAKTLCPINVAANKIAMKTRRGQGNFIIVSPAFLEKLVELNLITDKQNIRYASFEYVGKLQDKQKVFVAYMMSDDEIIVGYKGSDIDVGILYCPYVTFLTAGTVVDQMSYEPRTHTMTRAGLHKKEDAFCNGEDYYMRVKVTGLKNA